MENMLNQIQEPERRKYKPLYSYRGKMNKKEVMVIPIREMEQGWLFLLKGDPEGDVPSQIIDKEGLSHLKEYGLDEVMIRTMIEEEIISIHEAFDVIAQIQKDKLEYNRAVGEKVKTIFGGIGKRISGSDPDRKDGEGLVKAAKIAFNLRMMGKGAKTVIKGLNRLTKNRLLLPIEVGKSEE